MIRFALWLLLFSFALLGAAFFGFIGLAAFSDAQYRCPGIQCSDARGSTVLGGGLFLICSVVGWLVMRRLRQRPLE